VWDEARVLEVESNNRYWKYKESAHMACSTNPISQHAQYCKVVRRRRRRSGENEKQTGASEKQHCITLSILQVSALAVLLKNFVVCT
jgi:hypothetical protein